MSAHTSLLLVEECENTPLVTNLKHFRGKKNKKKNIFLQWIFKWKDWYFFHAKFEATASRQFAEHSKMEGKQLAWPSPEITKSAYQHRESSVVNTLYLIKLWFYGAICSRLFLQILFPLNRAWYRWSHPAFDNKANKRLDQNVKLFFLSLSRCLSLSHTHTHTHTHTWRGQTNSHSWDNIRYPSEVCVFELHYQSTPRERLTCR